MVVGILVERLRDELNDGRLAPDGRAPTAGARPLALTGPADDSYTRRPFSAPPFAGSGIRRPARP